MNWIDKLERKYRRYAVHNLILYLTVLNAIVFLFGMIQGAGETISAFALFPGMVLRGQIWRLFTFVGLQLGSWDIFIIFALYIFYMIGQSLEHAWGTFRFNLYFLTGWLGSVAAAFITGIGTTGSYIYTSMFLAFAVLYPNVEFRIFFILPVKVKYLGMLAGAGVLLTVVMAIIDGDWSIAAAAIVSLINFFLYFWDDFFRLIRLKRQVSRNRKRFFDEINQGKADNVRRFDRDR